MSYKLFLDDYRVPADCSLYMYKRIGKRNPIYLEKDWVIAKHYGEFVRLIQEMGVPDLISFDHDLADAHYGIDLASEEEWCEYYDSERCNKNYFKTGYHCAQWLIDYCEENKLDFPEYFVHSMNPVGSANITSLIQSYLR